MEIKFTDGAKEDIRRLFGSDLKYRIMRGWDGFKSIPREIKFFWQRGTRGWADNDVWSIDGWLLDILPDMIRQLSYNKHGCPEEFYDAHCRGDECHLWREFLQDMANKLESGKKAEDLDYSPFMKENGEYDREAFQVEYDRLMKEWEQGMDWFKKYFFNLWD